MLCFFNTSLEEAVLSVLLYKELYNDSKGFLFNRSALFEVPQIECLQHRLKRLASTPNT